MISRCSIQPSKFLINISSTVVRIPSRRRAPRYDGSNTSRIIIDGSDSQIPDVHGAELVLMRAYHSFDTPRHRLTQSAPDDDDTFGPSRIPIRLMPLGGSITYGQQSSHGNGYRKTLRDMLVSDGYNVEMVGSRKSGSMENNDNEGWRGFTIDQITTKARRSVLTHKPNIFTINAGSNDCLQDIDIKDFRYRMDSLLEYLWIESLGSTIVLSTLLVNSDRKTEERILHVNEQISKLVEQKLFENRKIVLADMHSTDEPQLDELSDGTHPNDVGYE